MLKTFIAIIVSGAFLLSLTPSVHAQTAAAGVQIGPGQSANSKTTETVTHTKKIGPNGEVIEKESRESNSEKNSAKYEYSGLPGKWTSGKSGNSAQSPLAKDIGPSPRYTLDRLPPGANSDEALWVKMDDGRLMMVDPRETQKLRR